MVIYVLAFGLVGWKKQIHDNLNPLSTVCKSIIYYNTRKALSCWVGGGTCVFKCDSNYISLKTTKFRVKLDQAQYPPKIVKNLY